MPDRQPGPTLRHRKLIKELVAARVAAGMRARHLAIAVDLQPGTISKIESGKQGITVRNVRAIARATGLSKTKTESLVLLAADDEETDWLIEFSNDLPDWFELYPALEQDAVQIWNYESELVHGLVQTQDYAETQALVAFPDISAEERRRSVELRIKRQGLLSQNNPPVLRLLLNEAVVHREVGGPDVHREQLRHLIELVKLPHITIRVLPFSAGAHPGMKTGFTMLRFPEGFDDMDCAYLENANGSVWQESPEHVAHYTTIFERLAEQALSEQKTVELLTSLI